MALITMLDRKSKKLMQPWRYVVWVVFCAVQVFSQEFIEQKRQVFDRLDLSLSDPLREVTLEDVDHTPGQEVIVLQRLGHYPNWKLKLSVYSHARTKMTGLLHVPIPADTIFYGFIESEDHFKSLLLVRPKAIEVIFLSEEVEKNITKSVKLDAGFEVSQDGLAQALSFQSLGDASKILIPVRTGVKVVEVKQRDVKVIDTYALAPRAYYHSASDLMLLDMPFWARASFWFPEIIYGSFNAKDFALVAPWLDETEIVPLQKDLPHQLIYFKRVSEEERQDGQSQVVNRALDLNGDGRLDFLINKFKGAATSLMAETTLHLTNAQGQIDEAGVKLVPEGNRAAGAVAVDLNKDGKMELAVASSQFNAWAIARALTQGQIKIKFSFYFMHGGSYKLNQPDFSREILFNFDLTDLEIEGILPSMQGDFNGDGYPDAFYAKNKRSLTVLLQKKGAQELFSAVPSGEYDVSVMRKYRIGDVNGDGKSDVVMYERRSKLNKKVVVLTSSGAF